MKIYQINEGPIHSSELEDYEDEDVWVVFALVENPINKALEEQPLEFANYDLAYSLVDHFKQQIIPYSLDMVDIYD